jgi:DNA-binding MarR family transcriptional regulator
VESIARWSLDVKLINVKNARMADERDIIDEWMAGWTADLPLDPEVEGIVDRIAFLNKRIKRMLEETLLEFELNIGEWYVLSALWNSGEPFQSSPGYLAKRAELTTGAMTNRLDGLEAEGLVKRLPDPDDRRGVIVQLTPKGRELWERSVGAQAAKEQFVASALNETERKQLNKLLRRMVLRAEQATAAPAKIV